ncbi:THAP domain-containing protein 1-like [Rhipicephalus microplus]|uniref:THAP domain-containing protein 1-like n=1 Tax=Rhipicephalus microplus TaxID=6941 RepID=UPI003F6B90C2
MPRCCVPRCKSRSLQKEAGVTFHAFPGDQERRRRWASAVRPPGSDWRPTKFLHVCSKHFAPEDLYPPSLLRTRLRDDAVPIILQENYFYDSSVWRNPALPK